MRNRHPKSKRPYCNVCGTQLNGRIENNWVRCSKCKCRWELTDDHEDIRSVTLQVNNVRHKIKNHFGGSNG